ncbi:MAG: hypothetical protein KGY80_11350 [Candidatus Thorarchaeota archaeon]|nr:hypothetical protein [Candidatus Thorarchaeota archaeon]
MNEFTVLMRMLTQPGVPRGAGMQDLLDGMGLPDETGRSVLFKKLAHLEEQLTKLGLQIKHDPIHHVFYIDVQETVEIPITEGRLPDRLAATLLVVLTLTYQEGEWVSIQRVKKFRKKSLRSVRADLRELEDMDFVQLDNDNSKVRPGYRVASEIDYETFFRKLTEIDIEE